MHERVLVTGATGFLGSHLALALANAPAVAEVVCLVRPGRSLPAFLVHPKVSLQTGDLTSVSLPGRGALLIHCAAERDPRAPRLWETNHLATRALCEQAAASDCGFVYASSQSVYGQTGRVPVPEGAAPAPDTEYGRSKLAGEQAVQAIYAAKGAGYAILRFARLYGVAQTTRHDGALGQLLQAARTGKVARLHGAGACVLDLLHVRDACRAAVAAARRLAYVNGVLNVGSGSPISVLELTQLVQSACPTFQWEFDASASERPGVWLDTRKIRALLGWEPAEFLQEDLRAALHTCPVTPNH